jgi:hypothetical protein
MSHPTATMLTRRRMLGVILAAATLTAAATRALFQRPARRLLVAHITRVQATPAVAFAIWRHNVTILAGLAVAMLCAHLTQASSTAGRVERVMLRVCDTGLCVWATGTAVLAGMLTGAYGTRQIRAFLPQAPVELAAWLLLIVLYIDVRRQQATVTYTLRRLALIAVILAAAAILELWAGL